MNTWRSYLHWSFQDEAILIPPIRLSSFSGFAAASFLAICICLAERLLTFLLDKHWQPRYFQSSRLRTALWRSALYWMVTFLRLCYMLISMSFHLGLLFVITTALGFAQFFIELHKTKAHSEYENLSHHPIDSPRTPLVQENPYALRTVTSNISGTRPRSRSKPDAIFIHPNDSNIARADAAALELGIGGDTEYVKGDVYTHEPARWETGAGRDMARALLGSGRQKRDTGFTIGDDSDSDESD